MLYKDLTEESAGIYDANGNAIQTFPFTKTTPDEYGMYSTGLEGSFTFNEATPKGLLHYKLNMVHGDRETVSDNEIYTCISIF